MTHLGTAGMVVLVVLGSAWMHGGTPVLQSDARVTHLATLVAAERAFAAQAVHEGQRTAWIEWFAPDGVMYRDGRFVVAQAFMRADSAGGDAAPAGAFDWRPVYGDVAVSGDLGYSTGPVRVAAVGRSDRSYFSIWRREPGGPWRVVVDLGTAVDFGGREPFDDPYVPARPAPRAREGEALVDLLQLERDSLASTRTYLARLDPDVRALRPGEAPVVGRDSLVRLVRRLTVDIHFEPEGGGVSRARDLAYTWGHYRTMPAGEQGAYAHAWRRDPDGNWRIVFDVARP